MRNELKILAGKSEEKKQLGRPTHKWKDTIKMDLSEIGLQDVDWLHLAYDRNVVGCCENGNEPPCFIKMKFLDYLCF